MPKKILFESAIHQFLWAGKRLALTLESKNDCTSRQTLSTWLNSLELINPGSGGLLIRWPGPIKGEHTLSFKGAKFYTRGDAQAHSQKQIDSGQTFVPDQVMSANRTFFDHELRSVLTSAKVFPDDQIAKFYDTVAANSPDERMLAEEKFHDEWAASEDLTKINVRHRNEAPTAPEMRHIRTKLGELQGRTLLDIGCGLGEASVYFALEGANVTATDLSPGMCDATKRLAKINGTTLETHVSAAEALGLGDRQFDIIYTGNTLHHADTSLMMDQLMPHLKPTGIFVSWDPVAYNPVINIYRAMADEVRTEDEHPLKMTDIRGITSRFHESNVVWYWLTANFLFVLLALTKIGKFHQTRMWKTVIDESARWNWIYQPLAAFDRLILKFLPFFRPLCWNVVIIARRPQINNESINKA